MPKWLHEQLDKAARKKGLIGERRKRYVFGGIQNWMKKQKGGSTQKKCSK